MINKYGKFHKKSVLEEKAADLKTFMFFFSKKFKGETIKGLKTVLSYRKGDEKTLAKDFGSFVRKGKLGSDLGREIDGKVVEELSGMLRKRVLEMGD